MRAKYIPPPTVDGTVQVVLTKTEIALLRQIERMVTDITYHINKEKLGQESFLPKWGYKNYLEMSKYTYNELVFLLKKFDPEASFELEGVDE